MLRAFDANGNVISEVRTAFDDRMDMENATGIPQPGHYQPMYQPQQVMTPEMRFIQASQIYNQRQAEKGIAPLSQQESQMLSFYNAAPMPVDVPNPMMYNQTQFVHPSQQQSQMFLQQQYSQRVGGMGIPVQPYSPPQQGVQNGLISYGVSVGNGDEYLKNTTHMPYGYNMAIQQQQALIAEKKERMRIQIEVEKKVLKAAYTFLNIPFTEEEIDAKFEPPKPPKLPTHEEQEALENQAKLDRISQKYDIMKQYDMTEEEYLFMTSPIAVQQRINAKNIRQHLIHKAYKEIHPDDISLVEFLNGPANILYQDSILMDIRNAARARYLAFDEEKYRSYLKIARPTIEISPPDHLKGRPSVFDVLKVDDSWFTDEAEAEKAEIRQALTNSGFYDPENYKKRKEAFLECARTGKRKL